MTLIALSNMPDLQSTCKMCLLGPSPPPHLVTLILPTPPRYQASAVSAVAVSCHIASGSLQKK